MAPQPKKFGGVSPVMDSRSHIVSVVQLVDGRYVGRILFEWDDTKNPVSLGPARNTKREAMADIERFEAKIPHELEPYLGRLVIDKKKSKTKR